MQDNESDSEKQPHKNEVRPTFSPGMVSPNRGFKKSVIAAIILLIIDVGITGSCLFSFLICPIWFFVSVIKNSVQRPGWKVAIIRIAFPPLIFWLVWTNDSIQLKIAEENASRLIVACVQFHDDKGKYPETLQELVTEYLPSVPRAKYCLDGNFSYFNLEGDAALYWHVGGFRKIYSFNGQRWSYLD